MVSEVLLLKFRFLEMPGVSLKRPLQRLVCLNGMKTILLWTF